MGFFFNFNGATMDPNQKKIQASSEAIKYIKKGIVLGVGTGSTVNKLIELFNFSSYDLEGVVSSSEATTALLLKKNIKVSQPTDFMSIDLYIDGADEATIHRHLIKGGGGALTREKILAEISKQFICIIDDSKLVDVLGKFPLPIEVIPMATSLVAKKIISLGGQPVLRENYITDNGNLILDAYNLRIDNPIFIENKINQVPGVVTVGIFANRSADILLVSDGLKVRSI